MRQRCVNTQTESPRSSFMNARHCAQFFFFSKLYSIHVVCVRYRGSDGNHLEMTRNPISDRFHLIHERTKIYAYTYTWICIYMYTYTRIYVYSQRVSVGDGSLKKVFFFLYRRSRNMCGEEGEGIALTRAVASKYNG